MRARAKFEMLEAPWSTTVSAITRWDDAVRRLESRSVTVVIPK
jgi:hypothetical protein